MSERDYSDPRVPGAAPDEERDRRRHGEAPHEPPPDPDRPDDGVWEDGQLREPGPGD